MTEFEFTLVLEREPDDAQAEAIAANVPSVTGLEGGGPVSLAHTVVDAMDFARAVTSTVQQIEAFGVLVVGLQTDDLISIKETATRTARACSTSHRPLGRTSSGSARKATDRRWSF